MNNFSNIIELTHNSHIKYCIGNAFVFYITNPAFIIYLEYIKEVEKGKNHLLIIDVNKSDTTPETIINTICQEYDNLNNYHYLAIIFRKSSWNTISEVAINCEFLKKEAKFQLFNRTRQKKIDELNNFLKNNHNIKYNEQLLKNIEAFFDGVSYGFHFNDLFVSDTDNTKILILQKIELDETVIACPDCMSKDVRGNSYPHVLQKSFECQNPNCPSRSKIGRGKRYDYFSVKRNLYLKQGDTNNRIDSKIAIQYRRDIFHNTNTIEQMLVSFYSFAGDTVKYISDNLKPDLEAHNRQITYGALSRKTDINTNCLQTLLEKIFENIDIVHQSPVRSVKRPNYSIYEGNSSNILYTIPESISAAITSPPYYNAREYSQWPTLICYLIDMLISAKSVFDVLSSEGVYLYNIGDIVGQDNV